MHLKIFDYDDNCYETPYDINDILAVKCRILSGDEVLTVMFKNGTMTKLDAQNFSHRPRIQSYFDCEDLYEGEELARWHKRPHANVWYKDWRFTEDDDE